MQELYELRDKGIKFEISDIRLLLAYINICPMLFDWIQKNQATDE